MDFPSFESVLYLGCKALVLDVLDDVVGEVDGEKVLVELEGGVDDPDLVLAHLDLLDPRVQGNGKHIQAGVGADDTQPQNGNDGPLLAKR